jgi:hypothetical protein
MRGYSTQNKQKLDKRFKIKVLQPSIKAPFKPLTVSNINKRISVTNYFRNGFEVNKIN